MDEDGNKKLNFEEFKTGLEEIELELSEDEINEIFKKFDTDEDENISVDEFIVGIRVIFFAYFLILLNVLGKNRLIKRNVLYVVQTKN